MAWRRQAIYEYSSEIKYIIITEVVMKSLLFGFTVGAIAGAVALKKMENSKVPEKALKAAQKKLED